MTELKRYIMKRDGLTSDEANELIENAFTMVLEEGMDPEKVLLEQFGLGPDYISNFLDIM